MNMHETAVKELWLAQFSSVSPDGRVPRCSSSFTHHCYVKMLIPWHVSAEAADQAEQRRQTAMTAERRPDSVHLFGADLMSTADCLQFFTDFAPVSVEWLNDTSCEHNSVRHVSCVDWLKLCRCATQLFGPCLVLTAYIACVLSACRHMSSSPGVLLLQWLLLQDKLLKLRAESTSCQFSLYCAW